MPLITPWDIVQDSKINRTDKTLNETLPDQVISGLTVSATANFMELSVATGVYYINNKRYALTAITTITGSVGDTMIWLDTSVALHTGTAIPADVVKLAQFDPLQAGQVAAQITQAPAAFMSEVVNTPSGALQWNKTTAPGTPSADTVKIYVTASGTSPNREVAWKIKNENGDETIISSVLI